jgi:hypothetical protein
MAKGNKQQLVEKQDKNKIVIGAVRPTWMKVFVWSVCGCVAVLGFWAVGMTMGRSVDVSRFAAQGWGEYSGVIVGNKIRSLWHAVFMTSCVAGFLWLFLLSKPRKTIVYTLAAWGLVLLVAGDAWLLSRHYVKTMPLSSLDENPIISMLKKDMPEHRVALVTQEGFYNWWLTFAFPYHGIQAVNTTQMPRMPDDYRNFFGAVGRNPFRYWQMASVGYVLAPVEVWGQLQKDPKMKDLFDLVWCYNVAPAESGVTVIPALLSGSSPAKHVVLRFKQPSPRYTLVAGWEKHDDQETLQRFAATDYRLNQKVFLSQEVVTNLPPLDGEGIVGKVEAFGNRSGYFNLRTMCGQPSLLRVAEKFDPGWKATVDGKLVPVLRADYLFQAVYIPAGTHQVILKYAPSNWPMYIQLTGMAFCLLLVIGMFAKAVYRKWRNGDSSDSSVRKAS